MVGKVASVPSPLIYSAVVPAPVTANVPDVVTGLLATVNAAGMVRPTDVTVPLPPAGKVASDPSPLIYCEVLPLAVMAMAGVVVALLTATDKAGLAGDGTDALTDVTVPLVKVGKVARLPSPLIYCDVVPAGVLNLPLNVLQSVLLSLPVLVADATGRLNV